MDNKEQELRNYLDEVISDETGSAGTVSKIIKALRVSYFNRIDDEALGNISRAKKEFKKDILEDLEKLQFPVYPRTFSSAEFINVLFDADTEDYRSASIDFNDVEHLITDKENKYIKLLSSGEVCDLIYYKLDDYGDQIDRDFSECKLEVHYDRKNPDYDQNKYNQAIIENHKVIYKEKAFDNEALNKLFEKFFNEKSLFSKRSIKEEIVNKCINNIIESKDKESALNESVTQYHLFRTIDNVKDVVFKQSSNKPKIKIK